MWQLGAPGRAVVALAMPAPTPERPEPSLLVLAPSGRVSCWSLASHEVISHLDAPRGFGASLAAWRPGGDWLIEGTWNRASGRYLAYHGAAGRWVYPGDPSVPFTAPFAFPGLLLGDAPRPALAFGPPDPAQALVVLAADELREYRYPEGRLRAPSPAVAALRLREPVQLAGSPGGTWIVAAGADGQVGTYDAQAQAPGGRVGLGRDSRPLALSASDAGVVALSTPEELRFYNAASGHLTAAHLTARPQTLLTWSADGELLLSAQDDGVVSLWRGESLQARHRWPVRGVRALAVNPDRTQAAVGGRRRVAVFDLDD